MEYNNEEHHSCHITESLKHLRTTLKEGSHIHGYSSWSFGEERDNLRKENDHLWQSETAIFEACDAIISYLLTFHSDSSSLH